MIAAHMPRVVKNSCGYRVEAVLDTDAATGAAVAHLQRLFVGAEGTLGLVTEATLNLVPLPAKRGIAMAYFPSIFASGEAVPGILALHPTACEIMDSRFLAVVRANDARVDAMLPKDTDTALLIEFEAADEAELDDKFADPPPPPRRHRRPSVSVRAANAAETEHLWRVRKSAVALMQRMPGVRQPLPFIEDICVHPTEMPACVNFLQTLFDREGVDAVMVGHMGDGNIHTRPVLDPKDPVDRVSMQRIYDEVTAYVLSVRGTMAGEHGDGLVHTPRLQEMYGEEIYTLFTRIKNAFDPQERAQPRQESGAAGTAAHPVRRRALPGGLPHPAAIDPASLRARGATRARSSAATAARSARAPSSPPCARSTRPPARSTRRRAPRPTCCGASSPAVIDLHDVYGSELTKAVTDYCIECGMCAVECPSRVNIPKLMLEAKSKYRTLHRATPVEVMLGHAETVSRLGSLAAPLANCGDEQRPAAPPRRAGGRHRQAAARWRPSRTAPSAGSRAPTTGSWPPRATYPRAALRQTPASSPTSATCSPTTTTRRWRWRPFACSRPTVAKS